MRIAFFSLASVLVLTCGGQVLAQGTSEEAKDNWGQEVKDCNASDCYSGGTSRGVYVQGQAQDTDTPGYAREIHDLANPGESNPLGNPLN